MATSTVRLEADEIELPKMKKGRGSFEVQSGRARKKNGEWESHSGLGSDGICLDGAVGVDGAGQRNFAAEVGIGNGVLVLDGVDLFCLRTDEDV